MTLYIEDQTAVSEQSTPIATLLSSSRRIRQRNTTQVLSIK